MYPKSENKNISDEDIEKDINSLKEISHRTIKNIIENDNLLIFPSDLNKSKDIDESKTIFNIYNDKIIINHAITSMRTYSILAYIFILYKDYFIF